MDMRSDFSDVEVFFQQGMEEAREVVRKVGEEAVAYAVANGDYQNRTGTLRASNRSEVDGLDLHLANDAEYASFVESKGYDVLSGAALYAEKRLKEEIA